ncbi:hypothetical protein MML48_2g00013294 [Holotrichia oblita]|uniref:Uncharacterized protein n=1 Tax=Holotrichia oblita TaxID=644536 RepID=A0ACB9TLI9_HOLOL|nr:hypothetical protein MML48_2g00013294 [Holotrichia oblita]
MMVFMPESPVLLVAKGKYDEAERAVKFYRGEGFDVEEDIKDMENYLNCNAGNFLNNIKNAPALKSCGILTALFILIEMSSISTTFIYEDMIYVSGDLYGITETGCTIISMSMMQIGIIIAACLIDTVGRRILLMISTGLTSLIMGLLGLYYLVLAFNEILARKFDYLVVWILYLSRISYGVGAAP